MRETKKICIFYSTERHLELNWHKMCKHLIIWPRNFLSPRGFNPHYCRNFIIDLCFTSGWGRRRGRREEHEGAWFMNFTKSSHILPLIRHKLCNPRAYPLVKFEKNLPPCNSLKLSAYHELLTLAFTPNSKYLNTSDRKIFFLSVLFYFFSLFKQFFSHFIF